MSEFDIADKQPEPPKPKTKQKQDRRLARELKREAQYYVKLIPNVLADLGYDHWIRKEARPEPMERLLFGKSSRQKVKILAAAYNEAAIYLRVDPLRLPYRVTIPMLKDEEILETLSVACGCKVTFQLRDYANGAWIVVHRDGVIASIPKTFTFKDAITNVAKSASQLTYCAGVSENMRLVMADLADMPNMIIAGSPGMGKSVHMNSILLQLMWRNDPALIKFLMIDLKGGMELIDYSEVPFLWESIITDIEEVVPAFERFNQEMKSRQRLLSAKARTLAQWNRMHKEKLPYLILVVDELAQVLRHPKVELSKAATDILGSILSISRATGGHCILCTQRPDTSVVSGYLKTNINTRVAFGMPTDTDSRVVLDTSQAADIDMPGRAWMLHNAKRFQLQTPWISPTLIRRTIRAICERNEHPDHDEVDLMKIIEVSLEKFGGSLSYRQLADEFKGQIGKMALQELLAEVDDQVIVFDDQQYLINPGNGGNEPRRLVLVEFDQAIPVQMPEMAEL
jgi:DNA segregation ATPase FtsK/SpoIIIE-like protein